MKIWLGNIEEVEKIIRKDLYLDESCELNEDFSLRQLNANEDDIPGVLFEVFNGTGYNFQKYFSAGANKLTSEGKHAFLGLSEHLRKNYPRSRLAVTQSIKFRNFAENGHLDDVLDFNIADLAAIKQYAIDAKATA